MDIKGPLCGPGSKGSKGSEGSEGKAASPCGAGGYGRLRRRVVQKGGNGPLGRGWWYRPSGDEYEVSVTRYFSPAVIAFTTLLHNPRPARKRRAEPLPAKGGRPPLAFGNTASRHSDTINLPLNQPALRAEPELPRASAQWRLEPGRRKAPEPSCFREYGFPPQRYYITPL